MRKNKKDIKNRIQRHELSKPNNTASLELFAKIQAERVEDGYKSEYDCLLELGLIDEVVVPKDAVNLFPYMKQKHMLVKQAMSDPKVRAEVYQLQDDFKEDCKEIDT